MPGPQGNPPAIPKTPVFNNSDWWNTYDATPSNAVGSIYPIAAPNGGVQWIQYVYFNPPTSGVAATIGAPVYFASRETGTVSNHVADAETYAAAADTAIDSFAGVLTNANVTPGTYTWILKSGYWNNFPAPASGAAKDRWVLSNAAATPPADNAYTRVAPGTALATAEAARAYVTVESVAASVGTGFLLNSVT